jgi:hypothetical protein
MAAVAYLLRGWPWIMVGHFGEADIWKSWALRDAKANDLPFHYVDAVHTYLAFPR